MRATNNNLRLDWTGAPLTVAAMTWGPWAETGRRIVPANTSPLAFAASLALLGGCASVGTAVPRAEVGPKPMQVEPVQRVTHGGDVRSVQSAAQGSAAIARQMAGEGRWAQTAEQYRRAVTLAPADAEAWNGLGHALAMLGQAGDAVQAFERASALAPQRVDVMNNLGYALLLAGRPGLAAPVLRQALALEPGHSQAHDNLQLAYHRIAGMLPAAAQAKVEIKATPTLTAATPAAAGVEAPTPRADVVQPAPVRLAEPPSPSARLRRIDHLPTPAMAASPAAQVREAEAQTAAATTTHRERVLSTLVEVVNGHGLPGAARAVGRQLHAADGSTIVRLANLKGFDQRRTVVQYRPGQEAQAREVAGRLGQHTDLVEANQLRSDVRVVLGRDLRDANARALALARTPGRLLAAAQR